MTSSPNRSLTSPTQKFTRYSSAIDTAAMPTISASRSIGRRVVSAPCGCFDHSNKANQGTTATADQVRLPDQGPMSSRFSRAW